MSEVPSTTNLARKNSSNFFFYRGPKETKEQDWDPDPAEISNKTLTEPDGSRIFLQSLAGSL